MPAVAIAVEHAVADVEVDIAARPDRFDGQIEDRRVRRRLGLDHIDQLRDGRRGALGLDGDAPRRVDDEAGETERRRLAPGEGTEPDALDGAAHIDPHPLAESVSRRSDAPFTASASTSIPVRSTDVARGSWMSSETKASMVAPSAMVPAAAASKCSAK